MGGARASHCIRLYIPGGGDTAAQLCGVTEDAISIGRVESAVVYCDAYHFHHDVVARGEQPWTPGRDKRRCSCSSDMAYCSANVRL
jgi:hypothetical protein